MTLDEALALQEATQAAGKAASLIRYEDDSYGVQIAEVKVRKTEDGEQHELTPVGEVRDAGDAQALIAGKKVTLTLSAPLPPAAVLRLSDEKE